MGAREWQEGRSLFLHKFVCGVFQKAYEQGLSLKANAKFLRFLLCLLLLHFTVVVACVYVCMGEA